MKGVLFWAVGLTTLLKLAIAFSTFGTNDVVTWKRFADSIHESGGAWLYRHDQLFNHPPFMVRALSALTWLTQVTGLRFEVVLRLPGIIADAFTLVLAAKIAKPTIPIFLLVAFSPVAILVSGFHGNTDPVMVCLVVLAIYLMDEKRSILWSGLAFGMAMNIKVAPVILLPVFVLWAGTTERRVRFLAGAAAIFVIASSPLIFQEIRAILGNVFGYRGLIGIWGLTRIASGFDNITRHNIFLPGTAAILRFSFMPSLVLLAFLLRRYRVSLFEAVAVSMFWFLSISPGFGVQYLSWLVPFSIAMYPPAQIAFAVFGGAFLAAVYNYWSEGTWYYADAFKMHGWSGWGSVLALFCWATVAACTSIFLVQTMTSRERDSGTRVGIRR